tara:strand:+ start:426 stop:1196 length:771 start_codon:yes stop_codon:yes gene_type:complete
MNLGFLGTGRISSSVIEGIFKSKLKIKKIYISPRNKTIAKKLNKRFKKVTISINNQQLIDKSNWVFLAVTPKVGSKILGKLNFNKTQKVISFISTINLSQLKKIIGKKVKIVRAIPLPPISVRKGPIPICPPDKQVKNFFNHLGTVVEIKSEKSSTNFWATSGMMAPFYELLKVLCDWLIQKGVKRKEAQKYITSLFVALSEDSVINSKKDLKYLVKDSQTPKGLNEQAVEQLRKAGFYRNLKKSLDSILKRLNKV